MKKFGGILVTGLVGLAGGLEALIIALNVGVIPILGLLLIGGGVLAGGVVGYMAAFQCGFFDPHQ